MLFHTKIRSPLSLERTEDLAMLVTSDASAQTCSRVVATCFPSVRCSVPHSTCPPTPFISGCFTRFRSMPNPCRLDAPGLEIPTLLPESLFPLHLCELNSWLMLCCFLFPSLPTWWVQLFLTPKVLFMGCCCFLLHQPIVHMEQFDIYKIHCSLTQAGLE